MINLGTQLSAVAEGERAHSFELFSRTLDMRWIRSALALTGSATVRRRKLPAEFVVWLVIGMALLRERSIDEVVRHLDLVLPSRRAPGLPTEVSRSTVIQARTRLGSSPLETLFHETAAIWSANSADALRWRGLAVYGVDGTTLRIPDTEENEIEFGRPHGPRGLGAYPQLRLGALMVLRSHLLADLAVGAYHTGEQTLAQKLWERLPEILQELWGLTIAYNLVRLEIEHVADRLQLPPRRISYRHALMLVRNFLVSAWLASPGVLPARLQALHQELTLPVLPERRPRQYPHAVKIKMSHYPKKPPPARSLKNTKRV